jgi:hypothetical protein
MASHTNSDDEELALAFRSYLLSLSSDDVDEVQAPASRESREFTPPSDEALRLSQLSSDDINISQLQSAPAGDEAHPPTPDENRDSDDEELALAFRSYLLSLSSDNVDDAGQRPLEGRAPARRESREFASPSNEEALRLSQLSSSDNSISQLRSAPAGNEAHPLTPDGNREDDCELALTLSQFAADVFDEQAVELNRQREGRALIERFLVSLCTALSGLPLSEVRTRRHPHASIDHGILR